MKKVLLRIALFAAIGFGSVIHGRADSAAKTPVVLELFTSEGCSSCPPADRLLQSLDEQQPFAGAQVVVLSEHVDYWNGDGWTDPFSAAQFTDRQRWYADQFRLDSVYTPQVVVDGERESVGGNFGAIKRAVEAALRSPKVSLALADVSDQGKKIKFRLDTGDVPKSDGPATVYVALAEDKAQSHVGAGENRGRALTHVAVVRTLSIAGKAKPGAGFTKELELAKPSSVSASHYRIVAFLQCEKSHRIIGAAELKI
jgi:hypothetical protein